MSENLGELQNRIDAVSWYHEFDFPNGLMARSKANEVDFHRRLWAFIEQHLNEIDFQNRSVLDIGCWNGKWSFYSEKRGAASVLASDDHTQNWAQSNGLLLAKELLGSQVETRLDVSVYNLSVLARQFDIVLCLGVYYHLIDPFYAFSQVRHRCHANSVVVFEGDVHSGMRPLTAEMDFSNPANATFLPNPETLNQFLTAAYLEPVSQYFMTGSGEWDRCLTVCRPLQGVANKFQYYKPPFGLAAYDPRFAL